MSMMALAQQLQSQGRGGDTILAHINPAEAAMLESRGGSGTLNPETGLPEYGFFSDLWDGVKSVWNDTVVPTVRKLAPVIIPAVAIFFPAAIPAIGAWFGATGTAAAVVGTAALSAGVTLASGGTLEQAIAGAALGAAASYVTPILGAKANALLGAQLSPAVQSYLGSALVSGGISAARGGSVRDVFTAAATGAATAYLGSLAKNYYQSLNDKIQTNQLNITQKTADSSLMVAADAETYKKAGLTEAQVARALMSQGVNQEHADLAAKSIVANNSAEQTALIIAEYSGKNGNSVYNSQLGKDAIAESVTLGNNTDILLRAEDASIMAQDAVALKAQGLSQAQIKSHLQASGATEYYATEAAKMAANGADVAKIADFVQQRAQYNSNTSSYTAPGAGGQVYNNTEYVVPREIGQVMNEQQQILADSIPLRDLINSNQVTVEQAATLASSDYTADQVRTLLDVGYDSADLADLAAVGMPPSTLTTLAKTQFGENQINDLFEAGATANDIATASRIVDRGQLDVGTATQLLSKDIGGGTIDNLVRQGSAQTVANSNLSGATVNALSGNGWDLNKAVALQNSGVDVNQLINNNEWKAYNQLASAPTGPAGTVPVRDAAGRVSYFEAATGNTLDASGRVITYARAPEVGGGTQTAGIGDVGVEVAGRPGKVGQESAVRGPLTPGNVLASDADIDSGRATFNDAANAWEMPAQAPESEYTYTTPPGETVGPPTPPANEYTYTTPPGEFVGPAQPPTTSPVTPPTQVTPTPLPPVAPPVSAVPPWMPDGSVKYGEQNGAPIFVTPGGELYTGTGDLLGNVTPPGQTMGPPAPPATQPPLSPLVPGDSTPRPPVVNVDITQPPPLTPLQPTPVNPPAPVTPVVVEPPVTPPAGPAPVEVITPPTPYVPVPTPPVGEDPATKFKGYGPITPLMFGTAGQVNNPGLNPGFIQPSPYYNTTSPVQSQYYYGQRPYQPGPVFDQALYNQVPNAPAVPFGLQQMYTPTDLNQYLNQFTQSSGPVAPR